ncbi:MAG: hypothetical protein H7A06_05460 [Pseudomonadales bacterium]|nr:hypothetical protein [Pseudomonadales bacterium]
MIIYRSKNPVHTIDQSKSSASIPEHRELFEFCDAKKKNGEPCRQKALYRQGRCKFHGGLSTGPKTENGKEQSRINGAKGGRPRKTQVLEARDSPKIGKFEDTPELITQRPQTSTNGDDANRKLEALVRKVNALRHA